MNKPYIIGLCGLKQSGKNFIADLIAERLREEKVFHVEQLAFADDVRKYADWIWKFRFDKLFRDLGSVSVRGSKRIQLLILCLILRLDPRSWVKEAGTNKRRFFLQRLGTDVFRRHLSQDFWVSATAYNIYLATPECRPMVALLTDVRFQNEANLCNLVIRVNGPESVVSDGHPSEQPWDIKVDIEIDNTDHTRLPSGLNEVFDRIKEDQGAR
jgi:hypothetical protein